MLSKQLIPQLTTVPRNGKLPNKHAQALTKKLSEDIKLVASEEQLASINAFRQLEYRQRFPEVKFDGFDLHDYHSYVFYSVGQLEEIESTVRLSFDDENLGLPSEIYLAKHLESYRKKSYVIAELGRFIINDNTKVKLKDYYRLFYCFAIFSGIDAIVMVMKQKDIPFHQRLMSITVLDEDIGQPFGGEHHYAVTLWDLSKFNLRFWQWLS